MARIMPTGGCRGDTVPLAVGRGYNFHEFGYYLGNFGIDVLRAVTLGPFQAQNSLRRCVVFFALFVGLTILTGIGGVALWLAYGLILGLAPAQFRSRRLAVPGMFSLVYAVATIWIVPAIAPIFGRVPLNCIAGSDLYYEANSILYCALNRHYVDREVATVVKALSIQMRAQYPGTVVTYLDGDYPLSFGLPLLPHKSHSDGRSLDLALFYRDQHDGQPLLSAGAWSVGYWAFAPSLRYQRKSVCGDPGWLRWRMEFLQPLFSDLELDIGRTAAMIDILVHSSSVKKIFVEPYLAKTLRVAVPKIRFAGCQAARHDDHIHIQIR